MTSERTGADTRAPVIDTSEKATLVSFLDYLRESLIGKATGIADEQGSRAGVPSGTSLLGLIKHLTAAELSWFVWTFDGQEIGPFDFGMEVGPDESGEALIAAYRAACQRSNAVIEASPDLQRRAALARNGMPPRSLRWILVAMIEETARHAGHADILREQIDGSTGR